MVDRIGERPIVGVVLRCRMYGQVDDDAVPRMIGAHGLPARGDQANMDVLCDISLAPIVGLGEILA